MNFLDGTPEGEHSNAMEPSSTLRRSDRVKIERVTPVKRRTRSVNTTPTKSPRVQSERQGIRAEVTAKTKPRRDTFLLHHAELFEALLPQNKYITKLREQSTELVADGAAIDQPAGIKVIVEEAAIDQPAGVKVIADGAAIDQPAGVKVIVEGAAIDQPAGVKATLKDYQLEGLSFLVKMYKNGMPAILGDEMGLGKTLQTLSLFQHLSEKEPTREQRPFLVICPLSVLSSWENEAKKWTPDLNVTRFYGSKARRTQIKQSMEKCDLCITTYETFVSERTWFQRVFVWRYIVLDEGHKIKNDASHVAHALQSLNAEFRLLLTGTPLQNDLKEMWSLLHWLLPDIFTIETSYGFKNAFDLSAGKVSTTFMDNLRRLLEILMLRRTKTSAGVNLNLPPKEEVILNVPLTAEQKRWYMTLLTRMDQTTFDGVFMSAATKEVATMEMASEERAAHSTAAHEISATRDVESNSWRRLMNTIMQLRKVCSHPYLLAGAAPDPYVVNDKVRSVSGKFIVLDKLINQLVIKERRKIIIFSGFTSTLDLCEDLLTLKGANNLNGWSSFKYVRLDGSTERAKRNLSMRLFNDVAEYKVILISTRAGGLGITLVSASDMVFLDEDWNPQITLQAEARAHRIGQTNKVTIYKLCAQGTVEEQMMSRIRKKLYLSAKITESMRNLHTSHEHKRQFDAIENVDDEPTLGTSELMALLRRGSQTLTLSNIDAAEMSSWSWEVMLEKCQHRSDSDNDVDEEQWLNQIEKVETAVFDGRKHQRSPNKKPKLEELSRADRRIGKNTTVMVDGFAINKESMACGDWEAVPTLAGKDPRLANVKQHRESVEHQDHCQRCWYGGELYVCSGCPRTYHLACLDTSYQQRAQSTKAFFWCPQHECHDCGKKTADAGGLLYRCRWCEKGFCEECLDWDNTRVIGDSLPEYVLLNHSTNNAWYVDCSDCLARWRDDPAAEMSCRLEREKIERLYAMKHYKGEGLDVELNFHDTPLTISEVTTPSNDHEVVVAYQH